MGGVDPPSEDFVPCCRNFVETSNCSPPDAMLAGLSRYFLGLAVIVIGVVS